MQFFHSRFSAFSASFLLRFFVSFLPLFFGCLVVVLLLLLLIMRDNAGFLGAALSPFFQGLFGYGAFAIPAYLLIIALLWKRDRKNGTILIIR